MRKFSACIEMLFSDQTDDFIERIGLAGRAGCSAIEFWRCSNKDIAAVQAAVRKAGVSVTSLVAEPMIALTDPANHSAFLAGLEQSIGVARQLGAGLLIAQAGDEQTSLGRTEQHEALINCLKQAAKALDGSGIVLGIEPLNTLIDHKGHFLSSTTEGLDIVDAVDSSSIRLVYDVYHSAVMGEQTELVLQKRLDRVAHIHVADHPGRNQPGSGTLDLAKRVKWIFDNGYRGVIGLEYRPKGTTADSLSHVFATFNEHPASAR